MRQPLRRHAAACLRWHAHTPNPSGVVVKVTHWAMHSSVPITPVLIDVLAAPARESTGMAACRADGIPSRGAASAPAGSQGRVSHCRAAEVSPSMAAAALASAPQQPRASATAGYPLTSFTTCCNQKRTTWREMVLICHMLMVQLPPLTLRVMQAEVHDKT